MMQMLSVLLKKNLLKYILLGWAWPYGNLGNTKCGMALAQAGIKSEQVAAIGITAKLQLFGIKKQASRFTMQAKPTDDWNL